MRLTEPIVITHAVRTPIGKFLGSFRELSAADLGVAAVSPLLAQANCDPADVQEVIMGNARQAGGGPNMARQIAIRSGVPQTSTAWTVNMACGSGLKSVFLAAESILLGRATIAVAGGAESMTRVPFFLENMRLGYGTDAETLIADRGIGHVERTAEKNAWAQVAVEAAVVFVRQELALVRQQERGSANRIPLR